MQVFRARHLASMTGPVIGDGCVVVEGDRIVDVGAYSRINPARIDHDIDGVLMPGLINAHTHLELTNIPRPPAPISFVDWILTISPLIRVEKETFTQRRGDAVRQGIAQCVKYGVTCVGDISQNVEIVRPILREGPIRSVSFGECLGIGERRWRFEELFEKAIRSEPNPFCKAGLSPHAPYTVDEAGYSKIRVEQSMGYPVSTHVAETPDEAAFLRDSTGPLRELYRRIGTDPGPAVGCWEDSPVEWLCRRYRPTDWLFAHVNYCSDSDLEDLADAGVSVVWCPRTHAYFGHSPHRWQEMMQRGVPVCVGTDSCASSPDLNVLDDLRLLYEQQPALSVEMLWSLVTTQADRALGYGYEEVEAEVFGPKPLGRIDRNAMADLVSFPTASHDPLREILETSDMLPGGVWVGGVKV